MIGDPVRGSSAAGAAAGGAGAGCSGAGAGFDAVIPPTSVGIRGAVVAVVAGGVGSVAGVGRVTGGEGGRGGPDMKHAWSLPACCGPPSDPVPVRNP